LPHRPIGIKGSAKEASGVWWRFRKPKRARDRSIEKLNRHARDKGRN